MIKPTPTSALVHSQVEAGSLLDKESSKIATTQTLPAIDTVDRCIIKTIKVSMGPPIGNRKVTVTTADGALIDGDVEYVMQSPYESITVILQGDDWHIISHFLP